MPLRFGAFTFDSRRRELARDGRAIHLSPKAFRLLETLVEARPEPVPHEVIYRQLWPDVIVEPGNLHGLIAELREALDDDEHRVIRTMHRVGYAFTAAGSAESGARFAVVLDGEEIPLRDGENIIGRGSRDAIAIHTAEVSRRHAKVVVAGSTVTLEDLGSKNGTFVGTRRITAPVEIAPGDEILVGTVQMRLIRVDPMRTTATAG